MVKFPREAYSLAYEYVSPKRISWQEKHIFAINYSNACFYNKCQITVEEFWNSIQD